MYQTKSKHPNSIVLASAKIEITHEPVAIDKTGKTWALANLIDLGLARGVKISGSSSKIEIKADNGVVPLAGKINQKKKVEFALLERHIPLLGKAMAGIVFVRVVPGAKTKKTETILANTADKDVLYEFLHANHDGAEPQSLVVKQGTKTLASKVDYETAQTASGAWAYRFLTAGAFDKTKATTIEYEITPIAQFEMGTGSGGIAKNISMRLSNKRYSDDGRIITRTFEFPFGSYDGEDGITFKAEADGDNAAEVPMSFEFSPHPELELDPDFQATSLMRELAEP